jgi:hypothetical protein
LSSNKARTALPPTSATAPVTTPVPARAIIGEARAAPVRIRDIIGIWTAIARSVVGVIVVRPPVVGLGIVSGRWRQGALLDVAAGSIRAEVGCKHSGWREREDGARS